MKTAKSAQKRPVDGEVEKARLDFRAGDRVSFDFQGSTRAGTLARANPRTAHVVCDDGREFRVPYRRLRKEDGDGTLSGEGQSERDSERLDFVRGLAAELFVQHNLVDWRFTFDRATRRAGSCCHTDRTITLAYEFARQAPDAELRETLLHEIAHALVGPRHNHDAVWRAKALAIGCSGQRCHSISFTPPRYVVTCENHCWAGTAERRRRNVVCRHCRGAILYQTYTEERFNTAREAVALHQKRQGARES
ncbi:MAG: SprT-like domain-containing protein [Deltaproteobacteria bacterium]|nr:SprT-like domain-containing protein [Deltaproteobacteria bacterium]